MATKKFALITGWAESVDSGFHSEANRGKDADREGLDMPLLQHLLQMVKAYPEFME